MSAPVTRNLTILLTDIKGFTDRTSHLSRVEIQELLDKHKEIVLPILEGKGGKLVKTIGDAFLMTFDSPTDAVLAGVQVQEALRTYNADRPTDRRIEIRIAINQGEVNLSDNDVFGEPVNITARIEAIAEANEVFFTDAVYLAMNKTEVPSSEVGLLQLKGIPEKVRVYKVKRETPVEGPSRPASAGANAVHAAAEVGRTIGQAAAAVKAVASGQAPKLPGLAAAGRPTLFRRWAALCIDFALCALIVRTLIPGEDTEVRVRKHRKSDKPSFGLSGSSLTVPASTSLISFAKDCGDDIKAYCNAKKRDVTQCLKDNKKKVSPACAAQLAQLKGKDSGITIDDSGIHGPGISIDDNGVHVPGYVSIDDNGVKIGGVTVANASDMKRDEKAETPSKRNVNIKLGSDGLTVAKTDDEDEGDTVYDEDGLSVKTLKKERKFPWFSLALFVYSLAFIKRLGTTVGGRICKLAVVQHPGGGPIDKGQNTMRAFFSLISLWCGGLGYLWAVWEKDGRGWHDLMAGTRVVSVE